MKTYKAKAPTVSAVELTDVLKQSPDVANMIGANSMSVDVAKKSVVLMVGKDSYSAIEGQVVYLEGTKVVVADADKFYAAHEVA